MKRTDTTNRLTFVYNYYFWTIIQLALIFYQMYDTSTTFIKQGSVYKILSSQEIVKAKREHVASTKLYVHIFFDTVGQNPSHSFSSSHITTAQNSSSLIDPPLTPSRGGLLSLLKMDFSNSHKVVRLQIHISILLNIPH